MIVKTLRPRLRSGRIVVAWMAAAVAGIITAQDAQLVAIVAVGLLAAGATAALVQRYGIGVWVAVLVLGGVDALPGPNLETMHIAFTIAGQDVVVGLLVLTLGWLNWQDGFRSARATRLGTITIGWAGCFLVLFALISIRTIFTTPVPLIHAVWIARPFAYLALLLPLFIGPMRDRRFRNAFLLTCGVGTVVTSLAQATSSASGSHLSFLVHQKRTYISNGLLRVRAAASAIPVASLPLGLGLVLFTSGHRQRAGGALIAIASVLAIALDLTRAVYVGAIAGVGLGLVLWLASSDNAARLGRRRALPVFGSVALTGALLIVYQPSPVVSNALDGVSKRVVATVDALNDSQSIASATLRVRAVETSDLEYALGSHWLTGLGFEDASYDYNPYLVQGTIENSDTGYLNIVMTMGLIGAILYYLPMVIVPLALLWRRFLGGADRGPPWITFGVFAWAVAVVLSSKTLVILFGPTGVVTVAPMLALGISSVVGDRSLGRLSTQPMHAIEPARVNLDCTRG